MSGSGFDASARVGSVLTAMVTPFAADGTLDLAAADASREAYEQLLARLEARFTDQSAGGTVLQRKQARQAARAVLPNDTETRIVVTGNYRAWRHFIAMRASEHADTEIRRLAIACLRQLSAVAPAVFADFQIASLDDGSEVATSPLATES